MALSASTVWEVRTTGSATNGGGYVAGSTGTDFSQQDAAQVAVADAVADGSTTITSVTAAFATTHVGNVIYLAGGTGTLTATRRQVVTRVGATEITVDAVVAAGTGITLNLGGALGSLVTLAASMVGSNLAWVESGTYMNASVIKFGAAAVSPSNAIPYTRIAGYAATRGDITPTSGNQSSRPNVLVTTLNANVLVFSNFGWRVENLIVGPSGVATCGIGITGPTVYCTVVNCKVSDWSVRGITVGSVGSSRVSRCECTGGTAGQAILIGATGVVTENHVHDIAGGLATGISVSNNCVVEDNLIYNCAGATSDGIVTGTMPVVRRNTVHNVGRHCVSVNTTLVGGLTVRGNVLSTPGTSGYGLNGSAAGLPASPTCDGNAYYVSTGLGARNNMDDVGSVNPANASAPYTNALDVTLTVDPFEDSANDDFRLNDTSGGGAECRASGVPSSWPGNTLTESSPDIGAVQHEDPGGGGTVPDPDDVRHGVAVAATTGTCHVPSAADVVLGVAVDATTGTFVVPAESQVEEGVGYGAAGAEFEGELTGGGMTLTQLQGELDTRSYATAAALLAVDDLLDTEVAAIKAKTDSLTFTVAGKVDANVTHVGGAAATVTAPATIAAAVRDVDNASPAAGSLGEAINDAGGGGGATAEDIAEAVWLAAPAGAALEDIAGAVVAHADFTALDDKADAIKAKTDNLPASPAAIGSDMGAVTRVTGAVGSVTTPVTAGTVTDKGGYSLGATGLDAIPMTLNAAPSTFREWFVWLTLRFRRTGRSKATGMISVYGTDGSTIVTTQTSTDTETEQTVGVTQ